MICDVLQGPSRYEIVHGDCLELLQSIPDTVRVITDGPYGVGDNANTDDDRPYLSALSRLRDCPSVAFFGYPERLIAWILTLQWPSPDEWVTWYPSNAEAKAGAQSKYRLPKLAECIAIYGRMPNVRGLRRERTKGGGKLAGKKGLSHRYSPHEHLRGTAQVGDVWTDPSPGIGFQSAKRLHPNEKPVTLMEKLVTLTSDADDVVLDPFCGSGTTGVACLRLGRRFLGIEKNAAWAQLARDRLHAESQDSTLQAYRAGQGTLFGGSR